jgi:hypothetical protein
MLSSTLAALQQTSSKRRCVAPIALRGRRVFVADAEDR